MGMTVPMTLRQQSGPKGMHRVAGYGDAGGAGLRRWRDTAVGGLAVPAILQSGANNEIIIIIIIIMIICNDN
jgi:hypothetical protein